jgi:hypothetical protein
LGGGGVALGVLEQLGELAGEVRRQLGREPGERRVEREHGLGVDDLHAKHVLDRRNDVYRASHIALYALYLLSSPPNRALTSEWDDPLTSTGNPTDI